MASPSASVGRIVNLVGLPASSAAEKLATFSASTATIFVFGRRVLIAKDTPANKPAPPHRYDFGVDIRNLLNNFEAHCPLAGNNCGIVVAVDVSEPFFLRE